MSSRSRTRRAASARRRPRSTSRARSPRRAIRVLCIDMDPQANLTAGLGINLNTVERSMADVLADGRATIDQIILPTETPGIDVAPANIDLAATEGELFTAFGREQTLRDALDGRLDDRYDYVLIDCPPNLGLLTVNGLVAANSVIIPVQTQYYAMKGLNEPRQGHQHDPGASSIATSGSSASCRRSTTAGRSSPATCSTSCGSSATTTSSTASSATP